MGWQRGGVVNGLLRCFDFIPQVERFSGVRVAVELREVAAGDIDAQAVIFRKHIARADQIDAQLISLAGLEDFRPVCSVAVPGTRNAFTYIERAPVGKHVDQLATKSVSTASEDA